MNETLRDALRGIAADLPSVAADGEADHKRDVREGVGGAFESTEAARRAAVAHLSGESATAAYWAAYALAAES